ncbi:MAG: DUF998 domain-containing protein [Ruminococcus sp.]|nr:DUF998 domain-containing protein [Ruminococcus sp.]
MRNLSCIGWYALLTAVIGDLLVSMILSLFYKSYSSLTMSISAFGNPQSPVRVPFNLWMFIEGVLFIIALPALFKRYHLVSVRLTVTLIAFISVFAIGACIFTSLFCVNESKDIITTASKIHGIGSVIGFMLMLFVPLILAILSYKNSESAIGGISIVCFIIAIAFFVLFVLSDKKEFANTIISYEGLWQRLNLLFMYIPIAIISVKSILLSK